MKVTQSAILNPTLAAEASRLGAAVARLRIARGLEQDQWRSGRASHEIRRIGWKKTILESPWANSCVIWTPLCRASAPRSGCRKARSQLSTTRSPAARHSHYPLTSPSSASRESGEQCANGRCASKMSSSDSRLEIPASDGAAAAKIPSFAAMTLELQDPPCRDFACSKSHGAVA
jgi:hypothetical protein